MKKVIILSSLACVFLVACGENTNKSTENSVQTVEPPMSVDSASIKKMDSTQAAIEKKTQDSIDAGHGHSH